jgi:predicted amidohydrolase
VTESADARGLLDVRARRIVADHRVGVVVASFAGSTGGGFARTAGGSAIWSADGAVLARAGPEPGAIGRATLRACAAPG